MKAVPALCMLVFGVSLACSGCTDSDREMANRKSDGTDTFKYVPSPAAAAAAGIPASKSDGSAEKTAPDKGAAAPATSKISTTDSKQSGEFKYKPSPRVLKQKSKS